METKQSIHEYDAQALLNAQKNAGWINNDGISEMHHTINVLLADMSSAILAGQLILTEMNQINHRLEKAVAKYDAHQNLIKGTSRYAEFDKEVLAKSETK